MKHKILLSLDENTSGPEVFGDLKPLLNNTHAKYLTGLRLQEYFETKLVLANEQHGPSKALNKMLNVLQYAINMEEAALEEGMHFDLFKGRLEDDTLKSLSSIADLMIIDRKVLAPFCGENVLAELVHSLYCPVLVLPESRQITSLLMVYDGSYSSIQSLKSFVSLFHSDLRSLPFSVLVDDPNSQKAMQQERVFIDYLRLFFDNIGVKLMDDEPINCLGRIITESGEKPMLLFGGNTGSQVLNCNLSNRFITDQNPSFIFRGPEND